MERFSLRRGFAGGGHPFIGGILSFLERFYMIGVNIDR